LGLDFRAASVEREKKLDTIRALAIVGALLGCPNQRQHKHLCVFGPLGRLHAFNQPAAPRRTIAAVEEFEP
jgi:hypothetical protein